MDFIERGEYARKVVFRVGLLIALTMVFPWFTIWTVSLTTASNVSGASGALAVVIGAYLKPLIYLGVAVSLVRPSWGRAKMLGLPHSIALAVPILMLGDLPFGIAYGAFWGVGFSLGILAVSLPVMLIAAFILMVVLSTFREEGGHQAAQSVPYLVWMGCIYCLEFLAVVSLLKFLLPIVFGLGAMAILFPLIRGIGSLYLFFIPHIVLLVLFFSSIWIVIKSWKSTGSDTGQPPANEKEPQVKGFGQRRT
jgi:hypothetical protein